VRNRGTEVYKSPEMLLLNAPAGTMSGMAAQLGLPLASGSPRGSTYGPVSVSPSASLRRAPSASPAQGLPVMAGSPRGRQNSIGRQSSTAKAAAAAADGTLSARGRQNSIGRHNSAAPPAPAKRAPAKRASENAGLASDVWSLGCLAYELLSGKVLFGGDYASGGVFE
jgi:serine/threonine protein kinase